MIYYLSDLLFLFWISCFALVIGAIVDTVLQYRERNKENEH